LLSHQRKREKKRVWRQFCEWLSEAAAHLSASVSLLLLEALFMQISGVSLTLTWPHRLCLLRVLLGVTTTATSFPLSKHTGGGGTAPTFSGLRVYLQFTWEVSLPPSPVAFSSHRHFYKHSRSWLLGSAAAPAFSSWLFVRDFPSPPSVLRAPHPLCYVTFLMLLLIIQVFPFFSGWGSVP
jgi:hypothetical protein